MVSVERTAAAMSCPDAETLRRDVNAMAGREAIIDGAAAVTLRIGIDRTASGFTASLASGGARTGQRELEDAGQDCKGLSQALTVSIALLLDEEQDAPRPRALAPDKPRARPPRSGATSPGPPLPRASIDVVALESAGVVGTSTFGVAGQADFRVTKALTVGGGVFGIIEDTERVSPGEIHLSLVAAKVPACFSFRVADQSISLAFCGYPALGALVATARGFDVNHTAAQPWFALGSGAMAEGPIVGPLGFVGRLDAYVPLVRPRLVVAERLPDEPHVLHQAYQSKPIGVSIGVGVRVAIP